MSLRYRTAAGVARSGSRPGSHPIGRHRHRAALPFATPGALGRGAAARRRDAHPREDGIVDDIQFDDIATLRSKISDTFSEWSEPVEVTQDMINRFAELTGDHQWIHVDVERA